MLTLIVARGRNGAIGKDGDIPWAIPEDLAVFQRETRGGALIMGRNTWDSLPVKPLKGRFNCVISSDKQVAETVCSDPEEALRVCTQHGYHRIYGIGGSSIYKALLPKADRLLITEVGIDIKGADTFFPTFDERDWIEIQRHHLETKNHPCIVRELMRPRSA